MKHPTDTGFWNQAGLGLNFTQVLCSAKPGPASSPVAHAPLVHRLNGPVDSTLCKGTELLCLPPVAPVGPEPVTIEEKGGI